MAEVKKVQNKLADTEHELNFYKDEVEAKEQKRKEKEEKINRKRLLDS